MNNKSNNLKNTGNWVGVGTAVGVEFLLQQRNQLGLL